MSLPPLDDRPILIAGPTASGKSALALEIAREVGGVIVNADALQVFEGWRILTARPTPREEAARPHRLYGHVPFDGTYSVGHWLRDIAPILRGPERPIVVGGTGLYFSALTGGLADIPPTPPGIRALADRRIAREGHRPLLKELDAATRARVDPFNPARVQRAWEVLQATGKGLAAWQDDTPPPLLPLAQAQPLVIEADRDWLARRIEARFDRMLETGALDEARANLNRWNPALLSSRAIGAAELIAHLRGEMSLDEARAAAQAASRQYAKRQRTWFRSRLGNWPRWAVTPT
ncbi:tRNA dimethylallyltransferase [Rhodovulum imhoffii]|uniref:tRNA dimethylallyltransferase n=1 Tax=Rhodovulum imhoffii TaxID=365340 RepID=A0A2T5BTM1_9RHOB|nr:tRNA (adenosine(37)-N6)-dimethylallyltransferase MiaA [Rhodovulum imhoffii]MBK5934298.1 tRNA (adenosine(37)-N6)-dimethylallyltransferase MiaA [Rhodovulum imhoffii]PTN02754.1 tRNA dimethylallyltransferase [Rhodovulum imhoffii]